MYDLVVEFEWRERKHIATSGYEVEEIEFYSESDQSPSGFIQVPRSISDKFDHDMIEDLLKAERAKELGHAETCFHEPQGGDCEH